MEEAKPSNRLKELDALRGIAAVMVVLFHLGLPSPEAGKVFKFGTTGVDLFFMISGFVIFMSISHVKSLYEFAVNRFARLYPTYWGGLFFSGFVICALSLMYYHRWPKEFIGKFLVNITMFQYFLGFPDIESPYWTLAIEMSFYFFVAFLYARNWLIYYKQIGVGMLAIISISYYFYTENELRFVNSVFPLFQFFPLFFSGMLFFEMFKKEKGATYLQYVLIAISFLCQLFLFKCVGGSRNYISYSEYFLVLSGYFLVFFAIVFRKLSFISNRPLIFMGKISYALYLIHQYFSVSFLIPYFNNYLKINIFVVIIFICVPILIVISSFITFYIEAPLSKRIKTLLLPKRT